MKRATTILRLIDNLEKELYERFTPEEIEDALNKERQKQPFYGDCSGLINVIDTGLYLSDEDY